MDRIRIRGGRQLKGQIRISGAKNAALPLMVASLLTDKPLTLHNVPRLADITTMMQLLQQHGQLRSILELATELGNAGQLKATWAQQEQLQQLPDLLNAFGSTVSAWVPQQQWCHSVDCCNLNMLRESVLVIGPGKKCAGCRSVRYCGRECQVQDWHQHKHVCKAWRMA